jgi:hypothetical protein
MTYDPTKIALGLKTIKHIEGNRFRLPMLESHSNGGLPWQTSSAVRVFVPPWKGRSAVDWGRSGTTVRNLTHPDPASVFGT